MAKRKLIGEKWVVIGARGNDDNYDLMTLNATMARETERRYEKTAVIFKEDGKIICFGTEEEFDLSTEEVKKIYKEVEETGEEFDLHYA